MTTADLRRSRTTAGIPVLLPVMVIAMLFAVAVLLAQIAPSRVTGIYEVSVGQGAAQFLIPTESLSCERTGAIATCTTPVGGRQLKINVSYTGPYSAQPSACTALHGDRRMTCESRMGDYGHAAHSVWISDGLGVTDTELAELRAAVPWWRTDQGVSDAAFGLVCVLAAGAGASTFLLRRRARPVPSRWRTALVAGTAVLAWALFWVSGLVLATPERANMWLLALTPPPLLAVAALSVWPWQLCRVRPDHRGWRWAQSIGATVSVAIYTMIATVVFQMQGGFID